METTILNYFSETRVGGEGDEGESVIIFVYFMNRFNTILKKGKIVE